jgi:C4-dicarboxylate transporter
MTASGYTAVIALASLEGALVALPKADALEPLRTLRSPAWAALLPGSIVAGTFLPLAMPSMALGLVLMAGVITPLLASGVGGSAAVLMASATRDVHGPVFSQADIGRVTTD